MSDRAEFETITTPKPHDRSRYPTKTTRCTVCGWETTARNTSLYGREGELDRQVQDHRLAHLEGRICAR